MQKMAKVMCKKTSKTPELVFKKSDLVENLDKVKRLRNVCRGGPIEPILFDIFEKEPAEIHSNMNVDQPSSKLKPQYPPEEDKKSVSKLKKVKENRLEQSLKTCDQNQDSSNDFDDAMSYISLLKSVKRRRKFDEISVDLQKTTQAKDQPLLTRRERLLSFVEQSSEIPGKFKSENSNFGVTGGETDIEGDSITADFESVEGTLDSNKRRPRPMSEEINPEGEEYADLSEARRSLQSLKLDQKTF